MSAKKQVKRSVGRPSYEASEVSLKDQGMTFAEYSKVKRQIGLIALRRTGFEMAKKHPAVWIFHAKNKLGMTDQLEVSGNGGQPIQFIVSRSSDKKKPEPEPDGV